MGVVSFVYLCSVLTLVLSGGSRVGVNSEPTQDKQALIVFINNTPHADRVEWNVSTSACDWVGVECDANRSFVYALRLPGVGLVGPIPPNSLGLLTRIRVLSLRSNRLSGSIPSDFSNLKSLRNLYLQGNEFSGEFPPSLTGLPRLVRLDLSRNNFTGPIPFAVNNLSRLTGLFLENNSFSGALPSISSSNLTSFDVSNNKLNGSIPATLARFPTSSFAGNLALCGGPLPACNSSFFPAPAESPSQNPEVPVHGGKSNRLSTGAIVGIVIGASVGLILLVLLLILCCRKRDRRSGAAKTQKPVEQSRAVPGVGGGVAGAAAAEAGTSSSKDDLTGESGDTERNRLVFFGGGMYSFDLEDLLRASAEVLGKGSVGTSYKAVLEQGITVVVKRLKDVVVSKKEFDSQMEILGNVKHENVVPLRAFYFSKDEKLLVYDFMPAGSLSALLHGSRGSGRTPLDWESRMRIAVGSARGLNHLHTSEKITHGNIKSSNILLRRSTTNTTDQPLHDASISDFGLHSLFGSSAPPNRVAGYRAPEVLEMRKATFKSDVYSFGVLLLELLTGKAPNQASLGDEGIDLPRWVQSVVREEWTAEVFDVELMRYHNIEEEMVQLLQIAMSCVSTVPDQRPSMQEVLRMIEDVSRSEDDGSGLRQSSDDPSKGSDGQTPPAEPRTPPSSVTP